MRRKVMDIPAANASFSGNKSIALDCIQDNIQYVYANQCEDRHGVASPIRMACLCLQWWQRDFIDIDV